MIEIPPFDVDALRDDIDHFSTPPEGPIERAAQWEALIADLQAAADHIDLLIYALKQAT